MCGICGMALSLRSSRSVSRASLQAMCDVLAHRGPDGSGAFIQPGIALGHRRLSIVDVVHGQQPMASDDHSLQIVYNGEVYNHPSLSAEFQAAGVRYNTHCDTETVLRAFEAYGARCVDRLRGMFAFAIWNSQRRDLFLARDRLGVKPLYYAVTSDGSLYFASEMKALFASGAIAAKLNLQALPDYLANHAPSGEQTLFDGVKRLLPGHTLRWHDGQVEIERYWDLDVEPREESAADEKALVAEYRERLRESVRLRLMADVPLGSFLSGGIDSAAITGCMSELVGAGVKTFSVAFAEREANELRYARLVADRFKTDHHEVVVTGNEFFAEMPRLVWHEDEPMAHPSSVPLNIVSQLAARHVKVVLTGEGSDETLAGYGRYRTTLLNLAIGRRWERWGGNRLRTPARWLINALPRRWRTRHRLARTFLYLPADLTTLYFDNFAVFPRARQGSLLSSSIREQIGDLDPYAAIQQYVNAYPGSSLLNQLLYADTKTYLHELLMKQDQMSMAASIESRVPFLDHPLMEFAARLPERLKLRGGTTKYVLREAMTGFLPNEILSRPKMGFPVPIESWFRGQFRTVAQEYVLGQRTLNRGLFEPEALRQLVEEHQQRTHNHWERLWSLVNLEIWQRLFLDGQSVDDATVEMRRVLGTRDVEFPTRINQSTANVVSTSRS